MLSLRVKIPRWEEMEKYSIELGTLAMQYELYNRTEGKSQATIKWYNLALKQFASFLEKEKIPPVLAGLGEAEVRRFILYLQSKNRWQEKGFLKRRTHQMDTRTLKLT
jgi:site-specific recombinase XerD